MQNRPFPWLRIARLGGCTEGNGHVDERHRHRYEVNPELIKDIEEAGLVFVGKDETGKEMRNHGTGRAPILRRHSVSPEFKSRPDRPSPPFLGLLMASSGMEV